MEAWLWGEMFPNDMDCLVAICTTPAAISGRNMIWREIVSQAIRSDPAWNNGNYPKDSPPKNWIKAVVPLSAIMTGSAEQLLKQAPTFCSRGHFTQESRTRGSSDVIIHPKEWGEYPMVCWNRTLIVCRMQLLARDTLRIVHVDDDSDFTELSARGLKRAGFSQPIVRCSDGILALHYFSMIEPQSAPHVILLDLQMPGMNGLEVLHWVRQSYGERDVAVYLLTSSEDPDHKKQAVAGGVTDYLMKNPLVDKLIEKLDSLISLSNDQYSSSLSLETSAIPG
jgi:CheY-like chemotaxis protein